MKIAVISSLFPPFAIGGAEEVAANLAVALHDLGHDIDVISTCRPDHYANGRCTLWNGVRVWRIAPRNLYWSFDKSTTQPSALSRACWHAVDLWNPSVLEPLSRLLDRIQPEVINTHNIDGLSVAAWQAGSPYAPLAHTLHDHHLVCPRATMRRRNGEVCESLCGLCRIYARYHLRFQRHVAMLIAPSRAIAEAHRNAGWTAPALEVIQNGLDPEEAATAEMPDSEPLRVAFLSRLEREKGCDTLLTVLRRLNTFPDIHFHLAGAGSYEAAYSRLASELPNTTWHGYLMGPDKAAFLARSDVFLQISECHENAPLGLIEAKRRGLYLVGSQIGGIPELIQAPEFGIVLPPGNPDALCSILQDLARRKREIRAGRSRRIADSGCYGTREMAREYVRVFRSLIHSKA
jgi:glycosyltransferase involved in cell wall biosynthesis